MDTVTQTNLVENNISAGAGEQDLHAFVDESAEIWPGSLLHKLVPQLCKLDLRPTMKADLLPTMKADLLPIMELDLLPTWELDLTMDVTVNQTMLPTTNPHTQLEKLATT